MALPALPLLALLATLGSGPLRPAVRPALAPRDDASLEALVERLRARRAEEEDRLRAPVLALVARLEGLAGGRDRTGELAAIHQELDALGPEAGPLLVPYVAPGPEAADAQRFRADQVTAALMRRPSRALLEPLVTMARAEGDETTRVHAVRLLGVSPWTERASAVLAELFRSAKGRVRLEAVASLARLGGPRNLSLLSTALGEPDASIQAEILRALAAAHAVDAAPAVLALAKDVQRARAVVEPLLRFATECPEALDAELAAALVSLAARDDVRIESRIAVLDQLRPHVDRIDDDTERMLEDLQESAGGKVREGAQVLLALRGDKSAKKALMRYYDEVVEKNERFAPAYEQRAHMAMRLEDYDSAVKDFKKVIELLKKEGQFVDRQFYIELARAYVLDDRLRQAADALEEGKLAKTFLERVAEDPDFEVLVHSRYGRMFDGVR